MRVFNIPSIGNKYSVYNRKKVYHQISDDLLNSSIIKCVDDKAKIFKAKKLNYNSPFEEIVGYLTGYKLIEIDRDDCDGFCDMRTSEMAVIEQSHETLYHEIGHAIQADLYLIKADYEFISQEIFVEQQCETIAYYLYNVLHGNQNYLSSSNFNCYFSKPHFRILKKWFGEGDLIDDLGIL